MLKRMCGKTLQLKSSVVKLVTESVERQRRKVSSIKETEKNSTTSGSTVVEVWITFGLLSSLVTQIGYANRQDIRIKELQQRKEL